MMDLISKNGFLFDPAAGLDGKQGDLAVTDGRITAVGNVSGEAAKVIDVSGLTVVPGLIDFHAHFYSGGTNTSLEYSRYAAGGVTGACDAGSAGDSNIESFISALSEQERRNAKLYINAASEGLSCLGDHPEIINPKYFNVRKICRLAERYPDLIRGIKIRISREITEISGTTSMDALRGAVEVGEAAGLPVSVHMPNFVGELKELIDILRPGDIFCHVFTPQRGILTEDGSVSKEMFRAREKGIILESACGKGHFGHDCARRAIAAGLLPDIISGDFTRNPYSCEPAVSLTYLMSRFLALGMTLEQVMRCVTTKPAEILGISDEVGSLKEGLRANITVLDRRSGEIRFTDVKGDTVTGQELLVPEITVIEGEIAYRNFNTIR